MKLNFGKRFLLFLHWLLSLLICALLVLAVAAPGIAKNISGFVIGALGAGLAEILFIAALAIFVLLSLFTLVTIFSREKKRSDRGMITVDSSDSGKTRVSMAAVEQMIRQAVRGVDGIAEMKCGIVNEEDAISVNINVTLLTGAHVPTVTVNMQRAIRGYIELNCGVAVREICVNVNSVESSGEGKRSSRKNAVAQAPAAPAVPESPVEETVNAETPAAELPQEQPAQVEESAEAAEAEE